MITISIFLALTAIEAIIIAIKIKNLRGHINTAKEIGMHLPFYIEDKVDGLSKFMLRIYTNYKGLLYVLICFILFSNLVASIIIKILIQLITNVFI